MRGVSVWSCRAGYDETVCLPRRNFPSRRTLTVARAQPLLPRHCGERLVSSSAQLVRPPRQGARRLVDFAAARHLGSPRRGACRRHQVRFRFRLSAFRRFILTKRRRSLECRCMIAGPEHSPYAGGLFEFDIFLPLRTWLLDVIRATISGRKLNLEFLSRRVPAGQPSVLARHDGRQHRSLQSEPGERV